MRLRTPLAGAQTAPWPTGQWATAAPAAQGMDTAVLAELADFPGLISSPVNCRGAG